ncbi:MAG: ATP-binding protein [Acidobacteria bacterium]|nr:ATP-binding protein [Acidobacteriota bacterium]
MATEPKIFVRSHVARDLLQNAVLFKTDKLVVWEYVSNSLQYVDPGTNPVVRVMLDSKNKRITVSDNGRGMDLGGLRNFFVMHGENVDRKEGRAGRGRFGTGKSAAFGVGSLLRITTARHGKRSKVELTKADIDAMTSEDAIPVKIVEAEVSTLAPNGTKVEIEGVHLKAFDQAGIIKYIERHLAHWPKNTTVFVNNHECEYAEPPVSEEFRFRPEGPLKARLGDIELTIKISKVPLEEDLRGVSIYSQGLWHETTLAGNEGREMAQYIFGEIDVPALEEDQSPIPPFDLSRSMRLNRENALVQAVYAFVGDKVDRARRELVERDKKRKALEDQKRLAREAAEIARVINEDFEEYRRRLLRAKATAKGADDLGKAGPGAGDDSDDLLFGGNVPARKTEDTGAPGSSGGNGDSGGPPRVLNPAVEPGDENDQKLGKPAGGHGPKPRPRGGFDVTFDRLGEDSPRAHYSSEKRLIHVNLDHPQIAAALESSGVDDPVFRRLAYEVAFAEYAIALAQELASRDEYLDPTDPIVDIRDTLNRVARKGARLYAS